MTADKRKYSRSRHLLEQFAHPASLNVLWNRGGKKASAKGNFKANTGASQQGQGQLSHITKILFATCHGRTTCRTTSRKSGLKLNVSNQNSVGCTAAGHHPDLRLRELALMTPSTLASRSWWDFLVARLSSLSERVFTCFSSLVMSAFRPMAD